MVEAVLELSFVFAEHGEYQLAFDHLNSFANDWHLRSTPAVIGYQGIFALALAIEAKLDGLHAQTLLDDTNTLSPASHGSSVASSPVLHSYNRRQSYSQVQQQQSQKHEIMIRIKNNDMKFISYMKHAKNKLVVALQQDQISDVWLYFWLQTMILEKTSQKYKNEELQEEHKEHEQKQEKISIDIPDVCIQQLYRYICNNMDNPNGYLLLLQYVYFIWPEQQQYQLKIQIIV